MAVDRCVCRGLSFADLIRVAREEGLSFEELSARTGCSGSCGLCGPYVRLALETGRADLPVLTLEQFAALGIPTGPGDGGGA